MKNPNTNVHGRYHSSRRISWDEIYAMNLDQTIGDIYFQLKLVVNIAKRSCGQMKNSLLQASGPRYLDYAVAVEKSSYRYQRLLLNLFWISF
jgi:hypothetical protein